MKKHTDTRQTWAMHECYIRKFIISNYLIMRHLITWSKTSELLIEGISCTDSIEEGAKEKHEQKTKTTLKKRQSGVPGADLHGHPLPTEVQACRRHCSRIFAFSPPLGAGIQVYLPAGTGRTPPRLLRIVCRCAPGSFSCMLDILLNTSFLDDMGDHSKSKFAEFLFFFLY